MDSTPYLKPHRAHVVWKRCANLGPVDLMRAVSFLTCSCIPRFRVPLYWEFAVCSASFDLSFTVWFASHVGFSMRPLTVIDSAPTSSSMAIVEVPTRAEADVGTSGERLGV